MNRRLYARLAFTGMRSNARFSLPYLLTGSLTVAFFYIICMIAHDPGLQEMPGADALAVVLRLGVVVVGLFSVVFLLYTNSFLIRRRKKEFGLFNILGMEKRHIGRILLAETLMTMLVCLLVGLWLGILLARLLYLLLLRIVHFPVPLRVEVSARAIVITLLLFGAVFLLTLLKNIWQICRTDPIKLLRGGEMGEREPKARWLLALLGLTSLGGGYYIALTVRSPIDALMLFFLAVLLVIVGTYLLFTVVSIALLKLLRTNRRYYYKVRHFTAVSGMLYRMKQNAVGLANICILLTMALVTVSSTVSLFFGAEDTLQRRYPLDISASWTDADAETRAGRLALLRETVEQEGREIRALEIRRALSFSVKDNGTDFLLSREAMQDYSIVPTTLIVETAEDYSARSGQAVLLGEGEVLFSDMKGAQPASITVGPYSYRVAGEVEAPLYREGLSAITLGRSVQLVVRDEAAMQTLDALQKEAYGRQSSEVQYSVLLNVDGTDEQKIALTEQIYQRTGAAVECREAARQEYYALDGGFLFLGMLLGTLFLMATALIIYYKQLSEGYEDARRYEILTKVGMTRREIRASITSQILTVFFLPLATAAVHILMAFPIIQKLLLMFGLQNTPLIALCTLATLGAFALMYVLVYFLTARSYYRVVSA